MEQPPPSGARSGESATPPESVEALELELARAKAELADYQALIDELPEIYEVKYRQQVQVLAQDIRRLADDRRALQQHLDHALPPGPEPLALPAAELEPVATPASPRRRPASLRLKRWRRGLARGWQRLGHGMAQPFEALRNRLPQRVPVPLLAMATALAVAALVVGVDGLRRSSGERPGAKQPVAPEVPAPPSSPSESAGTAPQHLRLQARGECWLEVQRLNGDVVLVATLEQGQQQRLPLEDGLRVRAGRPDLLDVAVGDGPFKVLNSITDLGWNTFLPNESSQSPAAELAPVQDPVP